jgi:hypothetical protein
MSLEITVFDNAEGMIMIGVIKWHILSIDLIKVPHMISNNIKHNPNSSLMAGIHEINKILLRSKVFIHLIDISAPISMISSVTVIDDWTDPYCIKSHSLDIV